MFKDWIDMGRFILFRYDNGYWDVSTWVFSRYHEEINQQLYAEYRGW